MSSNCSSKSHIGCHQIVHQGVIYLILHCFWPGLGLSRPKVIVVIPKKSTPSKTIYGKKLVKVLSTPGHYATKKSVEITMHLGLDNIIKLKFTTKF